MARKTKKSADDLVKVECIWPNVWTSNKKLLKGDTDMVSADEADALIEQGSCK